MEVLRQYVLIKSHLYYMSRWNDGGGVQKVRNHFTLWVGRWPQHLQEAQVGDIQWGIECSGRTKGNMLCNEKQIFIYIHSNIWYILSYTFSKNIILLPFEMIESRYSPPCCQCLSGQVWAGQHLSQHQAFCSSHIASPKQHIFKHLTETPSLNCFLSHVLKCAFSTLL